MSMSSIANDCVAVRLWRDMSQVDWTCMGQSGTRQIPTRCTQELCDMRSTRKAMLHRSLSRPYLFVTAKQTLDTAIVVRFY